MPFDANLRETWLHRANPAVKLILLTMMMLGTLLIHNPNVQLWLSMGTLLLFVGWSGAPLRWMALILLSLLFVVVSSSLTMIMFGKGETVWWEWGWIRVSEESFYRGIHVGFRSMAFACLGLVFSFTTRPVLLFYSLMQQLKLPPRLAYSMMAAIRLIPMLAEELQTLRMAFRVRGVVTKGGPLSLLRVTVKYAVPLLSQGIRRAARIAVAMEAKRFCEGGRTYYYRTGISGHDLLLAVVCLGMFAAAMAVGKEFPVWPVPDVRSVD
ncbi:energy-coupling factor transporter transmembrane component T family protein [Staphylospora marina]|uniref:energy-coupling factor transporter transmembrane component T family protein n=1 Tax=Staphylospora marina TaxID=2490858 RepID=UPI000F5C19D9|nr:energy-coupling factor transporter transmembrane component T [Staphylospora marina]